MNLIPLCAPLVLSVIYQWGISVAASFALMFGEFLFCAQFDMEVVNAKNFSIRRYRLICSVHRVGLFCMYKSLFYFRL